MNRLALAIVLFSILASTSHRIAPVAAQVRPDFSECADMVGYDGKLLTSGQRETLIRPSMTDPYADGRITGNELQFLKDYKAQTGEDYAAGDLEIVESLDACVRGLAFEPVFAIDPEVAAECERLAETWETNYQMSQDDSAIISGCRLTADGQWFLPTSQDDPRFPTGPILTPDEIQRTEAFRSAIEEQLLGLPSVYPEWMWDEVKRYYSPTKTPFYGYFNPDLATMGFQEQYGEVLVAYLQSPDNLDLYAYTVWIMQRKNAALPPSYCATMPDILCESAVLGLQLNWAPWPWDFADEVTIAEFLNWLIDNGYA